MCLVGNASRNQNLFSPLRVTEATICSHSCLLSFSLSQTPAWCKSNFSIDGNPLFPNRFTRKTTSTPLPTFPRCTAWHCTCCWSGAGEMALWSPQSPDGFVQYSDGIQVSCTHLRWARDWPTAVIQVFCYWHFINKSHRFQHNVPSFYF